MSNLIENDLLVAAIMEAVQKLPGTAEERFKALLRAGKIAAAHEGYAGDWKVVEQTLATPSQGSQG